MRVYIALAYVIVVFLSPYSLDFWWKFVPATTLILLAWRWARPHAYLNDLGLRAQKRDFFIGICVATAVFFIASYSVNRVVSGAGYHAQTSDLGSRLVPIFQALNEEMILRSLLLLGLSRGLGSERLASYTSASVFAAFHYVFCRFGSQHIELEPSALVTLFLFSLAGNRLFLHSRHIWFSYAIHVGWNLVRFGPDFVTSDGTRLREANGFNLIEGSPVVMVMALFLVILANFVPRRRHNELFTTQTT